jgi:hypothetical protein
MLVALVIIASTDTALNAVILFMLIKFGVMSAEIERNGKHS